MNPPKTGAEIRQSFIDFFVNKGHTFVPSSSIVPGGDQTLLFTNAGMVQFKEVFLGTDKRPYTRAVNSQKCMRVAGKHNDLDDVGRDNTHHTFFEMLGNWSFGDYYKKEAITWAWELLTEVWGLDRSKLWATCFKDDKGNVATDEEAAEYWRAQPGMDPSHVCYFGRKENFWEMAETGPCGPCSEVHIDQGAEFCDKQDVPGHVCSVNGDCKRFMELWNLVFIQYNRLNANDLVPLPATHVDTGMGLERIVSVMQGVYSNYKTDLLMPLMKEVQDLTGTSDGQRETNLTPFRVIADHARTCSFLIADGVIPGNIGRNYICRMIIRRAALFGSKIGLEEPFLARISSKVIDAYGKAYPELEKNRKTILDNLTREEVRFKRTVDAGLEHLNEMLATLGASGKSVLDGESAFRLYATHGVPLEITRDIAREAGMDVDVAGFQAAMEEHRLVSGAGKAFGPMGGEKAELYREILENLIQDGKLDQEGIEYNPYESLVEEAEILALVKDGRTVDSVQVGDAVEVMMPKVPFYIESGGQVADHGRLSSAQKGDWEIQIQSAVKPAAGVIILMGKVVSGEPKTGDKAVMDVDAARRQDIMRNHTATHLLHAELHKVLGEHARQAGSLVSPERLRFDFNQPDAVTSEQLEQIEAGVNALILENHPLHITYKSLAEAKAEGATALFGEKYGEIVRTVTIGKDKLISYELCGGTHVKSTGDIGLFLILSEGSAAAGIRRIEAVTGRAAYALMQKRLKSAKQAAGILSTIPEELPEKIQAVLKEGDQANKEIVHLRQKLAGFEFEALLKETRKVNGAAILAVELSEADADALRQMADRFRDLNPSGAIVLGSIFGGRPVFIVSVTRDLVAKGLQAGAIIKDVAAITGGGGGGKPDLAQAGGRTPAR